MIASVDKSTVSGSNTTETKMLGVILPEKLSSGLKTLLLMQFLPECVYNASNCGDNCVCWILSIAKKHGITINLYHLMDFSGRRFTATIANTGEIIHSMDELVLVGAKRLEEVAL